jgi:hypothetical protein
MKNTKLTIEEKEYLKSQCSSNPKERRVINIPKEQFDIINNHCEANTLDMPKWMVKNSMEKIPVTNKSTNNLDSLLDSLSSNIDNEILMDISKTYENINPEFRMTPRFLYDVLNMCELVYSMKLKIEYGTYYIDILQLAIENSGKVTSPESFIEDSTFIKLKNAYKDICKEFSREIQWDSSHENVYLTYHMRLNDNISEEIGVKCMFSPYKSSK